MDERPVPRRVRVVLGPARWAGTPPDERVERVRVERTRAELAEQSPIGDVLVRGLVRAKFAVALRVAAVVAVGLGGLPLLFAAAPSIAHARPFGVSLPWLLLGVAAYPFLFAAGAAYVLLTERIEGEFAALVGRPEQQSEPPDGHQK